MIVILARNGIELKAFKQDPSFASDTVRIWDGKNGWPVQWVSGLFIVDDEEKARKAMWLLGLIADRVCTAEFNVLRQIVCRDVTAICTPILDLIDSIRGNNEFLESEGFSKGLLCFREPTVNFQNGVKAIRLGDVTIAMHAAEYHYPPEKHEVVQCYGAASAKLVQLVPAKLVAPMSMIITALYSQVKDIPSITGFHYRTKLIDGGHYLVIGADLLGTSVRWQFELVL